MLERLARIKIKAESLWTNPINDTLALDRELGELEMLVHEARCEIDEEWRKMREIHFAAKAIVNEIPQSTLEELI